MSSQGLELASLLAELDRDGVAILSQVFSASQVAGLVGDLADALLTQQTAPAPNRDSAGPLLAGEVVYAARNVLDWFPSAGNIWRRSPLVDLLTAVLGADYGLTRALYFDKPPDRSWALPWHKDLTIAVQDNRLPSKHFSHPTTKAGVAHVEAPLWLLERMLTLRIHLDDVTEENGPLKVIDGSQRNGKAAAVSQQAPRSILLGAGDVLAMRPLVSHSSGHSTAGTKLHRRVLHLEFAGVRELPDGYAWQVFVGP